MSRGVKIIAMFFPKRLVDDSRFPHNGRARYEAEGENVLSVFVPCLSLLCLKQRLGGGHTISDNIMDFAYRPKLDVWGQGTGYAMPLRRMNVGVSIPPGLTFSYLWQWPDTLASCVDSNEANDVEGFVEG